MVRILVLALTLLLAGCVGISPPAKFYVLDAGPPPSGSKPLGVRPGLSIGLGPIDLPELVVRPEILTRPDGYSVQLSEFHRWAGELRPNMARVMARELMRRLNTERLALYPWPGSKELDYQVRVEVFRFDGRLGAPAVLEGTWTLVDGAGRQELLTQAFSLTETTTGPEYGDLVGTLSRLTVRLADLIAQGIARQAARSA
jgi:hypothetical protein